MLIHAGDTDLGQLCSQQNERPERHFCLSGLTRLVGHQNCVLAGPVKAEPVAGQPAIRPWDFEPFVFRGFYSTCASSKGVSSTGSVTSAAAFVSASG